MADRYEYTVISQEQADKLTSQPDWDNIAETRQSSFYWNSITGELLRVPNGSFKDDNEITCQKLIVGDEIKPKKKKSSK